MSSYGCCSTQAYPSTQCQAQQPCCCLLCYHLSALPVHRPGVCTFSGMHHVSEVNVVCIVCDLTYHVQPHLASAVYVWRMPAMLPLPVAKGIDLVLSARTKRDQNLWRSCKLLQSHTSSAISLWSPAFRGCISPPAVGIALRRAMPVLQRTGARRGLLQSGKHNSVQDNTDMLSLWRPRSY